MEFGMPYRKRDDTAADTWSDFSRLFSEMHHHELLKRLKQ